MSNDIIQNKINKIFEKIKNSKKTQYIVLICLIIVAIVVFMFGFNTPQINDVDSDDYVKNYIDNLENKLSEVLTKVNGAGKVSVIITVESGMETVLAMKTTTKEDATGIIESETSPIVINGKTVIIKEMYPKIVGVLIVAEGAKNISVMSRLQQATVSLLNIDVNQIEILST